MELENLRVLYDMVEAQYLRQIEARQGLDNRAGILFGAAAVLVGLMWDVKPGMPFVGWVLSLLFFAVALLCLLVVFRTRKYRVAPEPSELINRHDRGEDMDSILRASLLIMEQAYDENWGPFHKKVRWYRYALIAVFLGVLSSAVALIFSYSPR